MKNKHIKTATKTPAHYGFNVSFDIDDSGKSSKQAINSLHNGIKALMYCFRNTCKEAKIPLANLKCE